MLTESQIPVVLQIRKPRPVATHEAGHFVTADEFDLDPVPFVADANSGLVLHDKAREPLVAAIVGWSGLVAEYLLDSKIPDCVRPDIALNEDTIDEWLDAAGTHSLDVSKSDFDGIAQIPAKIGLQATVKLLTQRKSDLLRAAMLLDCLFDNRLDSANPLAQEAMECFPKLVATYREMGQRKFLKGGHPGRAQVDALIVGAKKFLNGLDGRDPVEKSLSMACSRTELNHEKCLRALRSAAAANQKKG